MSNTHLKYISSRVILGRVSNMFHTTGWRSIAISYLGVAIQELGYNHSTKTEVTPETELLTIANHKVEIPCNVEEITEIHYNGCRLPINTDVSMLGLSEDDYTWYGEGSYYMIDYPYIKTSFETGEIKLFVKKFMLDEDGYLMIPDDPYYRSAIQWHMVFNLMLDGEEPKNKQIGLDYAESKYKENKAQAQRELNALTPDRMRLFAMQWNTLNVAYNGTRIGS